MADYKDIAGRIRTTAADGIVVESQEIIDLQNNKTQQEINSDVQTELGDRYTKEETYSKEQLDDLITTPDVNYVSVVATNATTAVTDILPATGEANTIYRVGNWNGTQYDTTMYALFAWNGTTYVCLAVRSFVGEVYDVSVNHPDGQGDPTPYADLTEALGTDGANIPADIRRGGMSIKFIQGTVLGSDHKYVQYRLMSDSWSINTNDWSFCGDDVLVENPEWIYVLLDADERILAGLKSDGSVEWSIGVPTPVKAYIGNAIAEIKNGTEGTDLDGLNKIIAFLSEFSTSNTLKDLLDTKVDKEEGKSLIDAEYANSVHYIENPEFIGVWLDNDEHILFGVQTDGNFLFGCGVPQQVKDYIEDKISSLSLDEYEDMVSFLSDYLGSDTTLKVMIDGINAQITTKLDAEGLDPDALATVQAVENPEFMEVELDADDKILSGRKVDGTKFENNDVELNGNATVGGSLEVDGVVIKNSEDTENRSEITLDAEEKIISYRKDDGTLAENVGIETNVLTVKRNLNISDSAKRLFVADLKSSMNMPYMTKKFNLPDYGSIDIICELFYLGTDNKEYNPTKVTKVNDTWYVTATLTEITDPETGEISYEVNENSIATTYTEIDVDMEDTTRWPVDKTKHYCKVAMKFGDIDGTWYATVAFQGASTLTQPKKGLRITTYKKSDFAKKDKIKIGEMIATSKFNVKAYYGDPTRLRDVVLQRLVIEARNLRDYSEQYPWNNDYPIFTEAVGTIQSFPVKLTTSGNFYGVSMMGLAKDEHNFMLDGDETGMFISGDYVGPQYPLSFAEFHPETWTDEMNDVEEGEHTPSNLAALTAFWDWINNGEWNKITVPQHLSVIDWIDYYIFVQVFRMRDNDIHNIILYTKADKVKFYAFMYDLDLSFGRGYENTTMPIDSPGLILWKKFVTLYWDEIVYRYKELRSSVLNYNHVVNLVTSIQACIPYSDFEDEMAKWNGITYTDATKNMLDSFNRSVSMFDTFFL